MLYFVVFALIHSALAGKTTVERRNELEQTQNILCLSRLYAQTDE